MANNTNITIKGIHEMNGASNVKLSDIPVGETFKIGEYKFVVLKHFDNGTTAVVLKNRYVSPDGSVNWYGCGDNLGVRPFCIFKSSITVNKQPVTIANTGVDCEPCCCNTIGDIIG